MKDVIGALMVSTPRLYNAMFSIVKYVPSNENKNIKKMFFFDIFLTFLVIF